MIDILQQAGQWVTVAAAVVPLVAAGIVLAIFGLMLVRSLDLW